MNFLGFFSFQPILYKMLSPFNELKKDQKEYPATVFFLFVVPYPLRFSCTKVYKIWTKILFLKEKIKKKCMKLAAIKCCRRNNNNKFNLKVNINLHQRTQRTYLYWNFFYRAKVFCKTHCTYVNISSGFCFYFTQKHS